MVIGSTAEEILGLDKPLPPNVDTILFKMMLDFSIDVFKRLEELGLKQKDLANLLNVSPAAVSKMLSPTGNLSLRTMAKVAVALGCEFNSLHMVGVSDTSYVPLSDYELLTTLVTDDDPYGIMIDEDFGTVFWTTDYSNLEDSDKETEPSKNAPINIEEETCKQVEVHILPLQDKQNSVQESMVPKGVAA